MIYKHFRSMSVRLSRMLVLNLAMFLLFDLLICCRQPSLAAAAGKPSRESVSVDSNEFAEFEEFDDDDDEEYARPEPATGTGSAPGADSSEHPGQSSSAQSSSSSSSAKSSQVPDPSSFGTMDDLDSMVIEDDDEEFETIKEELEEEKPIIMDEKKKDGIEITKIPLHLRASWESYYLEFIIMFSLVIYFLNYAIGKSRNTKIATTWLEIHKDILDYNFALVGDDGRKEIQNPGLLKETENIFMLWCSGRISIDGLLIEIRLLKRQDLASMIMNYFKPISDKILIKAFLSQDAMDNFVFCIAQRKIAPKLSKEINDLATYCPERKSPEKYGITSDNYLLLNEIGEAASFILDAKVISLLDKNDDIIEYLHISDQYSGVRNDDTQPMIKLPDVKKVLILSLNLPASSSQNLDDEMDRLKPLLQMVIYLVDKLKRFRLTREKKAKSERNRQKVEKLFLQSTHLQRQEAAQMKREEKRRAEKEKMLQETDPDKQRKWEEKEYKRELKRKIPKMKQLKVKA